jgi:ubiquinone/menaquinone biosynthesis C-methylase UbiE
MMGEKTIAAYDAFAEDFSFFAWATSSISSRGYDEAMAFLPKNANRALEAGCGSGYLSLRLASHFNHIVAVDLSIALIKLAKRHQKELQKTNVDFVVADLVSLPFREGTFDFVVSITVLHDTPMEVTLPELSRMVNPNGRMVLCDLVTLSPRFEAFPLWQILRVLRTVPRYALSLDFRTMWRVVSFQLSPAWIRYVCDPKNKKLTPKSFREIYNRFLPGCRFERIPKTPWKMTAFWEATKTNS